MLSEKWFADVEKYQNVLESPVDFNEYFEKDELFGVSILRYPFGTLSVPTGEIIVADPLAYLYDGSESFLLRVPVGEYPAELCIIPERNGDCARNAAMRVKFNEKRAVRYSLALTGTEDTSELADFEDGDYWGFPVDAGLGCICDRASERAYVEHLRKLAAIHGDEFNAYYDFMEALFKESYENDPKYQREGGDRLDFVVPDTELHIPICNSGFGDGRYPTYWGFDADDEVCEIVVQFIDIKLTYGGEQ
ncbi:MAG: DUF4241 domain-containing protein [Ruminococcus sp.]|uniref:DUF4241 domain-containing protein n=1 Tax=Ruminococcus sp. TaxID=41978 RepID=UPI0025EBD958|nr:DUF4241 domain-containing protein [Ruminococcus sp.]MCR5541890.1 DUF4241 domain-containing protein [Ruminococcus sp.]